MLQKYKYLCALAREKHFGRAAETCHVSQPTLSNGLRQLEERLNVKLIERGQKFVGLTPEGVQVLEHAKRMLAEQELLLQALNNDPKELRTQLRIGAIPTTIPFVSSFIEEVMQVFPNVTYAIETLTSKALSQKIIDFEIDLGMTYTEPDVEPALQSCDIYKERYYFIVHRDMLKHKGDQISWEEAATYPLCLLTPNMQNRRMADDVFREVGTTVLPVVEGNSLINLYTNVKCRIGGAIVPHQLLEMTAKDSEICALKLISPVVSHNIGIVTRAKEPQSYIVKEIFKLVRNDRLGLSFQEN